MRLQILTLFIIYILPFQVLGLSHMFVDVQSTANSNNIQEVTEAKIMVKFNVGFKL